MRRANLLGVRPPSAAASLALVRTPELVTTLLRWFPSAARDLPWRRTIDPYAIWVSEIMLQQTQVKTVLPYWERWMAALPTVSDLAKASPQRLHKLWEGLGYYTRVRNLQKAAKILSKEHNGQLPQSIEQLLALPGIGRYTAGALSSIAFNQPAPILDGNVIRVLTRVFAISRNPRDKTTNTQLWHLAETLVQIASAQTVTARPCSHFNQALMELGALVCTPRDPECDRCPVAQMCRARAEGRISELPNLPVRAKSTRRHFAAFIVQSRGRFLVRQRPAGVVNGHLWEFPNTETTDAGTPIARLAFDATGLASGVPHHVCRLAHTITRYRITLDVFRISSPRRAPRANEGKWLKLESLKKLPFSSAHKRILEHLQDRHTCKASPVQSRPTRELLHPPQFRTNPIKSSI